MKMIGLTGGIGSGKTTVGEMFQDLGIPVYNSDKEARRIMNEDVEVRKAVMSLLGKSAYKKNVLDRNYVASMVFGDTVLLQQLNEIVHPAVRKDFRAWASSQTSPYVIQEAAILFENGGYKELDDMILVTAPKEIRIDRIKKRDNLEEWAILERMKHQWPEEKKMELAHFIIHNEHLQETLLQVRNIHEQLILKYT